ncbi:helix-turn-helix domain-containing protein [Okibacterium endophyticum]
MDGDPKKVRSARVAADRNAGAYGSVRSIERALALLSALADGPASASELAKETGVNRTSIYRLLATLDQSGYVTSRTDGSFRLASKVLDLSAGVDPVERAVHAATPILRELTAELSWPVNFATYESGSMIVQVSTHRLPSRLRYRDMTGQRVPLISGVGASYLSQLSPDVAEQVIHREVPPRLRQHLMRAVDRTQTRGYTVAVEQVEGGITSLALPLRYGPRDFGTVNLVSTSRFNPENLVRRNLVTLRNGVASLERAIDQLTHPGISPDSQ